MNNLKGNLICLQDFKQIDIHERKNVKKKKKRKNLFHRSEPPRSSIRVPTSHHYLSTLPPYQSPTFSAAFD